MIVASGPQAAVVPLMGSLLGEDRLCHHGKEAGKACNAQH